MIQTAHSILFLWVGRLDPNFKMLRLARVVWQRGRVGDGRGYSVKLSVGLRPKLFQWNCGTYEWALTFLGIRLHYQRSYGGIHT